METGLRAGELRSLTRASFDLDAEPPTVTVAAAYSKRRRDDTLILRPELADDLRAYLCSMAPVAVAFKLPKPNMIIRMFKADLEAAGIPSRDDAGRVADFHALRHTFHITNLASGGVHPKTAQSLARHSDITLTMNCYSHSYRDQEIDALRTLPDLSNPSRQRLSATGTEDGAADDWRSADYLAQNERRGASDEGAGRRQVPMNANDELHEKPHQTGGNCRSDGVIGEGGIRTRDTGLTPYDGLANRCLQPLGHLSLLMLRKLLGCDILLLTPENTRRWSLRHSHTSQQTGDRPAIQTGSAGPLFQGIEQIILLHAPAKYRAIPGARQTQSQGMFIAAEGRSGSI